MTFRLRFVVLHHTGISQPHFDVMVERTPGGPLMTWRSPLWPLMGQTQWTRLDDHRNAYLTNEGPVSDGRGKVRRVFQCSVKVAGVAGQHEAVNLVDLER